MSGCGLCRFRFFDRGCNNTRTHTIVAERVGARRLVDPRRQADQGDLARHAQEAITPEHAQRHGGQQLVEHGADDEGREAFF